MFKEINKYYKMIENNYTKATYSSYSSTINMFLNHFNIKNIDNLSKITQDTVREYIDFLSQNKNAKNIDTAKNSANAHLRVLKAFFNWLLENNYVLTNPCVGVKSFKEQKTIKPYLSEKEHDRMIMAAKSLRDKLIISLPLYTGIRVGEMIKIKKSDISGNHLLIHGKGRKERALILNDFIMILLNRYLSSRNDDCEFLFVSKRDFGNSPRVIHGITTEAIRQITKRVAKKAGIEENRANLIAPHTFRRTFAIKLARELKASAFQIQKALGHENIITTQRYLESAGSEIADEVMLEQKAPLGFW